MRKVILVTFKGPCIVTEEVWKQIQEECKGVLSQFLLTLLLPKGMTFNVLDGMVDEVNTLEEFKKEFLADGNGNRHLIR